MGKPRQCVKDVADDGEKYVSATVYRGFAGGGHAGNVALSVFAGWVAASSEW